METKEQRNKIFLKFGFFGFWIKGICNPRLLNYGFVIHFN